VRAEHDRLSGETRYIRIFAISPGEAPLWVREKWVGLRLPLADGDRGPRDAFTSGVLSGPRNRFIATLWGLFGRLQLQTGYAVGVNEALGILEKTSPDAASWWRVNVPRLQKPKRKFLFHKSVCELVDVGAVGLISANA
jgi:hypothetical protein